MSRLLIDTAIVLALATAACGLKKLDDATFERMTQASTGQTTGIWCGLRRIGSGPV